MLTDGTCIYSQTNATRLKTLVEVIDREAWGTLTKAQKDGLLDMYETYTSVMDAWDIENIKAYKKA